MILATLTKQLRMTDSAAAEGAYQDVAPFAPLDEGRQPHISLDGLLTLQRPIAPQNPKIGSIEFANLISSTIVKKDSAEKP
ncbi:MAG TPA: hypothetical protein VFQ89_08805 [Candidatus Binatia bacterium]|nr:hypothetical protein [Candidatus Binatia bacterium]